MSATIIYYGNLDYDLLPTAKRRRTTSGVVATPNWTSPVTNQQRTTTNGQTLGEDEPDVLCELPPTNNSQNYTDNSYYHQRDFNYSSPSKPYQNIDTSPPPNSKPTNQRAPKQPGAKQTSRFTGSANGGPKRQPIRSRHSNPEYSSHSTTSSGSSFSSAANYISGTPGGDFGSSEQTQTYHCAPRVYERPSNELLLETLKKYFKFDSFRENQLAAVEATCMGLDTLILMPTGGGKSICYQLPAIISKGITIVVCPLKSLITDQVTRLRSLNVKTSALFSDTTEDEVTDIYMDLRQLNPKHKLLYVTPEKINASTALISLFKTLHKNNLLARFVIDEAHCVSMWGADFRPDYRKLGKLREMFPDIPIMALTATAPIKVREDILDQLKMNKVTGKTFIQSFNRPNLKFEVRVKSKGCMTEISNMIRANFNRQCGIVYCLSRNDCEQVAEGLREQGIASAPYHAGLSDDHRQRVFSAWTRGTFQVVCATIAFGMGIDKADVRFVIHYSMPKSVEGYYQEAGRAGRDGKFAACILYFSKSDLYRMRCMLSKTGFGRKVEDKKRDQGNLQHMIDYVDNKSECRRTLMLRYLGEEFDRSNCISRIATACDNCLSRNKHNYG